MRASLNVLQTPEEDAPSLFSVPLLSHTSDYAGQFAGKVFIWQEIERIDESGESKETGYVTGLVDKCFDSAIYGV